MSTQPNVVVEISPAGSVKIEANGFTGGACAKATESLEVVLGGAGQKKSKKKPEFYQTPSTATKNKLTF